MAIEIGKQRGFNLLGIISRQGTSSEGRPFSHRLVLLRGDAEATGMSRFQAPMHSLHQAVGKRVPDELKLLITNRWIFFGDSLHRAVKFADAPTRSRRGWLHVADITLL
jgi:hypothetical protein